MTIGMGLRVLFQALVFLIIAKILDVEDYGAYSAMLALAGALSSFTGLGTHSLLVRDISIYPDTFASAWGRTLITIIISAPILFVCYLVISWFALPHSIPFIAIFLLGIAEIILAPISVATVNAYQGYERIKQATWMMITPILPRLIGALVLVNTVNLFEGTELRLIIWVSIYTFATLIAAIFNLVSVIRDLGLPCRVKWTEIKSGFRQGLPFAIGGSAIKVYADIDKTMTARLSTLEAAGVYSAGYRIVDIATVPVFSLLTVATPRFFRSGESNNLGALNYASKVIFAPFIYTIIIGFVLFHFSYYLPLLLGRSYTDAVSALRWLAWLPLFSLPRIFLQTVLFAGKSQNPAVTILTIGAALNIALNIWSIPLYSWRGAVVATYAAEFFMAVIMMLVARKI